MAPLKLALVAASAAALAPASTPLVSRKLALQEFGIPAAGMLGGATLFAPPAEALTQEEKDALYQEFKAKKERKQDLRRANSYSDKARGENKAGALPDEDLAAKLADKTDAKQMKSLAREAPGAKKPKDIQGKDTIRTEVSPRHVPDDIIVAPGVPHTRTGKKLEVPIKKLFQGGDSAKVVERSASSRASAGTLSPTRSSMMSPGTSASAAIACCHAPARRQRAVSGCSFCSAESASVTMRIATKSCRNVMSCANVASLSSDSS